MKLLVSSLNYADEFDVAIVSLFSKKSFKALKKAGKKKLNKSMSVCFGTNEDLDTTVGEVLDMMASAKTIKQKEIQVLEKFGLFNLSGSVDIVEKLKDRLEINISED
jgi:hypothetical protein